MAFLTAEALVLVNPADGTDRWLRAVQAPVAITLQAPAEPCGDAVSTSLPEGGGALPEPWHLPSGGSLALRASAALPENFLEGLALNWSSAAPEVWVRQQADADLGDWLLYPRFTLFAEDGTSLSLVFRVDHDLGGPVVAEEVLEPWGAWRLRGRRLSLRGPDGRWRRIRVHRSDGGGEVRGIELDSTFPQHWFLWGESVAVSEGLTTC